MSSASSNGVSDAEKRRLVKEYLMNKLVNAGSQSSEAYWNWAMDLYQRVEFMNGSSLDDLYNRFLGSVPRTYVPPVPVPSVPVPPVPPVPVGPVIEGEITPAANYRAAIVSYAPPVPPDPEGDFIQLPPLPRQLHTEDPGFYGFGPAGYINPRRMRKRDEL